MSHDRKSQSLPSNQHIEDTHPSQRPKLNPDTLYPSFEAFKTIARHYAAYYKFEPKLSPRDQQRVLFRCKGQCDSTSSSNEKKSYQKSRHSPYPLDHATKPHCTFSVGVRKYKKKGDMVAMIVKNSELRHSCGVKGELEMDSDSGDIGAARILWRAQSGISGEATPTDAMSSSAGDRSQAQSMERGTGSDGMFSPSLVDEVMMELVRDREAGNSSKATSVHATEIGTRHQQQTPRAPFPPNSQNFQRQTRLRTHSQNQPTTERGTSPMAQEFVINPSKRSSNLADGHVLLSPANKTPTVDPILEQQLDETKTKVNRIMYQVVDLISNGFPTTEWQVIDLEIQMARDADRLLQRLLSQIWDYYLVERTSILPSKPPYFSTRNAIEPPVLVALTVGEKVEKLRAMRNVVTRGWNDLVRRAEDIVKDWRDVNWADSVGLNPDARKSYLEHREQTWRLRFSELEEVSIRVMKLLETVKGFGQMSTIRGIQRANSIG